MAGEIPVRIADFMKFTAVKRIAGHEGFRQIVLAVALNSSEPGVWADSIRLQDYGFNQQLMLTTKMKSPPKKKKALISKWGFLFMSIIAVVLLIIVAIGFSEMQSRMKSKV